MVFDCPQTGHYGSTYRYTAIKASGFEPLFVREAKERILTDVSLSK